MQLTISYGWSFGLLFLLALLAIIVVRAPYVHGLLRSPAADSAPAPALQYDARIADQPRTPRATEPATLAAPSAPSRPEPAQEDAAHAPEPDTGLASAEPRDAAVSSPFAAPPPEPAGGTDAAHDPAPPKHPPSSPAA